MLHNLPDTPQFIEEKNILLQTLESLAPPAAAHAAPWSFNCLKKFAINSNIDVYLTYYNISRELLIYVQSV